MRPVLVGLGASLQPAQTWGAVGLLQEAQGLLSDGDIVRVVELVGVRLKFLNWDSVIEVYFEVG